MTYAPRPLDTSNAELPGDVQELVEQLSEHNHDVWARQRLADGWSWGPQRDDQLKHNPCLVPYNELPEAEKEYDRNTAREVLKAILTLGYRIDKPVS